ncbi:hypothetical protein D3C80_194370 [compost metagenome]
MFDTLALAGLFRQYLVHDGYGVRKNEPVCRHPVHFGIAALLYAGGRFRLLESDRLEARGEFGRGEVVDQALVDFRKDVLLERRHPLFRVLGIAKIFCLVGMMLAGGGLKGRHRSQACYFALRCSR